MWGSPEGQVEEWKKKEELDKKRETAAGTKMQEERLVDINDGEKWKDGGFMFWYFLWVEIFYVTCGKEVEARRSTEWKVGKRDIGFWKLFSQNLEKQSWLI